MNMITSMSRVDGVAVTVRAKFYLWEVCLVGYVF